MLDKEKVLQDLEISYAFYTSKAIDSSSEKETFTYSRYSVAILEILNNMKSGNYDINKETCKWKEAIDCSDWIYTKECGDCIQFAGGSLSDNEYKYCPCCGKEIEEVKND